MESSGSYRLTKPSQFTRQAPAPGTHGLCAFAFSHQADAGRAAAQPLRHLRSSLQNELTATVFSRLMIGRLL